MCMTTCIQKLTEGTISLGAGVMGGFKLPDIGAGDLNLGLMQEQYVFLLTSGPSLQSEITFDTLSFLLTAPLAFRLREQFDQPN